MNKLSDRWRLRLVYFFYFGGLGFFLPYISVFLKDQGLTGTQIGLVLTASSLLSIILVPGFSKNRLVRHYLVFFLQFLLLFSGGMSLVLRLNGSIIYITMVFSLFTLSNAFIEPLVGTLFVHVSKSYKKLEFGGIRNWGSLGWSITSVASGFIIMKTGYAALFYILLFSFLITLFLLFEFKKYSNDNSSAKSLKNHKVSFREILKHKELVVLCIVFLIESIAGGMPRRFEGIYLIQLGGTAAFIGIMASATALMEIPFMVLADRFYRKFTPLFLLKLQILLGFINALIVFLFPNPFVIMATSVLSALAYSIYMVLQIELARTYSDKQSFTAVLALFQVSILQLAGIISSPVAGIIFDRIGPWFLYLLRGVMSILSFLVLIVFLKEKKQPDQNSEDLAADVLIKK